MGPVYRQRKLHSIVSIMISLVVTVMVTMATDMEPCPEMCSCSLNILNCHGNKVPVSIPSTITEVYLTRFLPVAENQHPFKHPSWQNITKLDIVVDYPSENLFLASRSFLGLHNLLYLGIHGITGENPLKKQYFNVFEDSLYGLVNLTTLDLSGNSLLGTDHVVTMLKSNSIVPRLEILNLNKLYQLFGDDMILGNYFFQTFSNRTIKEISLDETTLNIYLWYINQGKICSTLQRISLKSSTISTIAGYSGFTCPSLNFVDISNATIPFLQFALTSVFFTKDMFEAKNFDMRFGFLFNIRILRWNNFAVYPIRFEGGVIYDASNISIKTQILQFRGNHLQWFDTSMMNIPFPKYTEIDVSYNELAYLNPNSLYPGKNICKLDLSHNNLYVMEHDYSPEYEIILKIFSDLEDINLSTNRLTEIPYNLFSCNSKLTKIDISNNKLKTFFIKITHLTNLKYLDASKNQIKKLDVSQMNILNKFAEEFAVGNKFSINLSKNEFECSCSNLNFVKWVKQASFLTNITHTYQCEFDEKVHDMQRSAFEDITAVCNQRIVLHTAIISTLCCTLIMVSFVIAFIIFRKRQKNKKKIQLLLQQIKQGEWMRKYLVFLSYCSEDGDFAMSHIYPQLKNELCKITQSAKDCICVGEKDFRPGFPIADEVITTMEQSAVMICVMSNAYCLKYWCQMEIKEASMQQKPILLLFKEDIDEKLMSPVLRKIFQRNTRSKVTQTKEGQYEINPSWSVLCTSIIELAAKSE